MIVIPQIKLILINAPYEAKISVPFVLKRLVWKSLQVIEYLQYFNFLYIVYIWFIITTCNHQSNKLFYRVSVIRNSLSQQSVYMWQISKPYCSSLMHLHNLHFQFIWCVRRQFVKFIYIFIWKVCVLCKYLLNS